MRVAAPPLVSELARDRLDLVDGRLFERTQLTLEPRGEQIEQTRQRFASLASGPTRRGGWAYRQVPSRATRRRSQQWRAGKS